MVSKSKSPKRINLRRVFLGLQTEMVAKLQTARRNIHHPGTKGDVSENSWLKMLETYLPRRYAVQKAIIVDSDGNLSDAIDVVVFDRHFSPFLFHQEGACYIPAESVYAVFEVKQKLDKSNLKYAAKKAASVRRLKRTSTRFAHSGGISEPVPPKEIIAGILTLTSQWKSGLGGSFSSLVKGLPKESRLNLGCVLKAGSFELVDCETGESKVRLFPREEALIQFFLAFLAKLQKVGSVPAMDIRAYAGRIGTGTES